MLLGDANGSWDVHRLCGDPHSGTAQGHHYRIAMNGVLFFVLTVLCSDTRFRGGKWQQTAPVLQIRVQVHRNRCSTTTWNPAVTLTQVNASEHNHNFGGTDAPRSCSSHVNVALSVRAAFCGCTPTPAALRAHASKWPLPFVSLFNNFTGSIFIFQRKEETCSAVFTMAVRPWRLTIPLRWSIHAGQNCLLDGCFATPVPECCVRSEKGNAVRRAGK